MGLNNYSVYGDNSKYYSAEEINNLHSEDMDDILSCLATDGEGAKNKQV